MNFFTYLYLKSAATALDADELKTPFSECTAAGGPTKCRFHSKELEDDDIRSYVTKAENQGTASKPKWREVKKDAKGNSTKNDHSEWMKKGKHDKWYALKPVKESSATPNFDSFASVPALDAKTMSAIPSQQLYVRGNFRGDGAMPAYDWTKGGKPVSEDDAKTLEGALKEKGLTSALNKEYSDVAVRPDLYNGEGQVTRFRNKSGEVHNDYTDKHVQEAAIAQYKQINALLPVYGKIKDRIFDGCEKGDEAAILAYFLMRTKIRAGSKKDPTGGRGATDLERGDFTLSDDGETFYISFNGKSKQWWHVTCKDKFLYDYIDKRKKSLSGAGANDESIFKASYGELNKYLKEISSDLVPDGMYMTAHDFRRVGATRIARDYLAKELVGVDPVKDRKKWEDRIVKAVIAAARHLNDQPQTVFDTYIAPNILFESNPSEMYERFPFLKGIF